MLTILAIIAALFAGWALGELSGYNRCVKDYSEASENAQKSLQRKAAHS